MSKQSWAEMKGNDMETDTNIVGAKRRDTHTQKLNHLREKE